MEITFDTTPIEQGLGTIEFDGMKFSIALFKFFAMEADTGSVFRFVRRDDKVISFDIIEDSTKGEQHG